MADVRRSDVSEPETVEIPLNERSDGSKAPTRQSSTSTSSFEDLKAANTSTRSDAPTLEAGGSQDSDAGTPLRGPLAFKTTSFDDPTFYAQTPPKKAARTHMTKLEDLKGKTITASKSVGVGEDRDPDNVNEVVRIRFEEVFAEPEGSYSFGTIWGASYRIFTDSKIWCYKFMSALCGVPCALCWGMHFACLSFLQIWTLQPGMRSLNIQIRPLSRIATLIVRSLVQPCFEAVSYVFSNIRVHHTKD